MNSQRSTFLYFLSAGIKSMGHHAQLCRLLLGDRGRYSEEPSAPQIYCPGSWGPEVHVARRLAFLHLDVSLESTMTLQGY